MTNKTETWESDSFILSYQGDKVQLHTYDGELVVTIYPGDDGTFGNRVYKVFRNLFEELVDLEEKLFEFENKEEDLM